LAHLHVNIIELRVLFFGTTYNFETTAPPDYLYLKNFQTDVYKQRFLKSRGLEFNKKNTTNTEIKGFKIKEDEEK
jgi:hypothetical protein